MHGVSLAPALLGRSLLGFKSICKDIIFFFSSRRRHTRFDCDWSSDVCSSDLGAPERVDAVILDGPPSFELAPADEDVPFEHLRTVARTRGMAAFRREWLRHPLTQLRTANPQMHAQLIAMIERFAGNEFTDSPLEPEVLPVPALPRSSNAPALVLSGELDVPRRIQSADRLSVQLPRAERAVITGAGHLPNLDRPDEYTETCRAFLNRYTRARSTP